MKKKPGFFYSRTLASRRFWRWLGLHIAEPCPPAVELLPGLWLE